MQYLTGRKSAVKNIHWYINHKPQCHDSLFQLYGRMVPAFKGLGYGMLFTSFLGDVYYAMILGWCIFYTCVGFTSNLPWQGCNSIGI